MGGSKKITVGYKYYLGMHLALTHGPVDLLKSVKVDGRVAWAGATAAGSIYVNSPELFGGDSREGGISGIIDFADGNASQGVNTYLQSMLGANIPAFRGISALVLRQCYLGNNPYLKRISAKLQRIYKRSDGVQWYSTKAAIPSSYTENTFIVTADTAFDALNADLVGANGLVVSLAASDTLMIEQTTGLTYEAFSYFPMDSDPAAGGLPWSCQISVKTEDGTVTHYRTTRYATAAAANEASITAGPISISGHTTYTIFAYDTFSSNNRGGLSLKVSATSSILDMNPSHIIRECLTDKNWGMGYQDSDIDDAAFTAAADTLYDESMGISIIWDRQTRIEDFIQEIIKHIYATLYVDRITGKFVLKLIRNDYIFGSLLQLDESNIVKIENYSRPSFGDLTNSVTVNYHNSYDNKTASVTVQDTALVQLQGSVIGATIQYPGFSNYAIAAKAAQRDLVSLSSALLTCSLIADRTAASLNVGSVIKLYWPDFSDEAIAMRITALAFGDGKSNSIRITCIEDIFQLPQTVIVSVQEGEWVDVIQDATPSDYRVITEAPYFELVQRLGQTEADQKLVANNDIGYILAAASRSPGAINARLAVDSGAGYSSDGTTPLDFCPYAFLTSAIDYNDTVIAISGFIDMENVDLGSHAQIGAELVKVVAISSSSLTIGRGVLDTVPISHTAGAVIMFWDVYSDSDLVEYVSGETINAKILPTTGSGTLDIALATADMLTFVSRAYRPYAPGKLRVNTLSYPETIGGSNELTVSWAHRDRLQQTAGDIIDTEYASIGPEVGTTYELKIYGETNVLIHTETAIIGTSYTYPTVTESSDSGLSNGGDISYSSVKSLLNFQGADASTTITDEKGLVWTVYGNAQIDNSLGYNTLLLDGTTDYITTPHSADFDWWNNDYTMEAWINPVNLTTWSYTDGPEYTVMLGHRDIAGFEAAWGFGPTYTGALQFRYYAGTTYVITSASGLIANNTLYHVAMSKIGSTIKLAINGTVVATGTRTGSSPPAITRPIVIGQGNNRCLSGRIKAIRLTKGVGRFSANFTPIAAPFPAFAIIGRDFNGRLRFTLKSIRGAYSSYQMHDYTVERTGYGFNYGKRYGN